MHCEPDWQIKGAREAAARRKTRGKRVIKKGNSFPQQRRTGRRWQRPKTSVKIGT